MALVAKYPPLSLDEQNEQIRLSNNQIMVVEPSSNTTEDSSPVSSVVDPQVDPGAKKTINWDDLKKQYSHGISRQRIEENSDSVNWGAVRQATEAEVAKVILDRGMNNQLADRIKVLTITYFNLTTIWSFSHRSFQQFIRCRGSSIA